MTSACDLALEYFHIGNAVTAFYVVQTLLFLNALYKEQVLVEALCSDRQRARLVTWGVACTYIFIVLACLFIETYLRYSYDHSEVLLISNLLAGAGRIIVIFVLATGCTKIISLLKPRA